VAITATPRTETPAGATPVDSASPRDHTASFARWAVAAYLAATLVLVAAIVWWLGGRLVYVLDDPAIHLSMAERLAHDGTWGVVGGHFESASSSPLWTLLVAAGVLVAGPAGSWVPLVLNVAAGVAVIAVLASAQRVVLPGRRRPEDVALTVVVVVLVLFLPGLAVVGMEHTLHVALVLGAVVGVHRWALGRPGWAPAITCALLALATLTRFETAFVAAGLAAGLLVVDHRAHLRRAVAVLASSAVPIVVVGIGNRALGGGWLPNSILGKGQGTGRAQRDGLAPVDVVGRLTQDPALALLLAVAVAYLVVRGRRGASAVPAVALLVAAPLHALLADVGWYERYQAYLIGVGVYLLLGVLAEVPADLRRRAVVGVIGLAVVLTVEKANLLVKAPLAADDMYRQQYQAGVFLDRYYDEQPVATDQLGYISYLHDGPLTDFAGLGDYEVLLAKGTPRRELWPELARERGFRVAVLYESSVRLNVPPGWIMAGEWRIDGEPVTGVSTRLQFFATTPDEVQPLQEHLRDFEDDVPARSELSLNEGAGLQAMAVAAEQRDGETP
jgi:hypothetical protein